MRLTDHYCAILSINFCHIGPATRHSVVKVVQLKKPRSGNPPMQLGELSLVTVQIKSQFLVCSRLRSAGRLQPLLASQTVTRNPAVLYSQDVQLSLTKTRDVKDNQRNDNIRVAMMYTIQPNQNLP
eukprot:g64508.t1